jgi:hypothetical protein
MKLRQIAELNARRGIVASGLALMILLATIANASAHGTGKVGYHDHGAAHCYDGGYIHVSGPYVNTYAGAPPSGEQSQVIYRANLYRLTGSGWVLHASGPWQRATRTGNMPYTSFSGVPKGSWATSVEIIWQSYDGRLLGHSPDAWVDSHMLMRTGQYVKRSVPSPGPVMIGGRTIVVRSGNDASTSRSARAFSGP